MFFYTPELPTCQRNPDFLVSLFVVKKYDFGQDSSLTKWKFRRGRLDAIVRIVLVLILHYKTCFKCTRKCVRALLRVYFYWILKHVSLCLIDTTQAHKLARSKDWLEKNSISFSSLWTQQNGSEAWEVLFIVALPKPSNKHRFCK
jgi:hypothetical protein